jgi:hypothetical protein
VADGQHTIGATAYDAAGQARTASVSVDIRNGGSVTPGPTPTLTPTPTPTPSLPIGRTIVEWTPASTGPPAASFRVYVAPIGGRFEPAADTVDTWVTLSGLGLIAGLEYRVHVTALSAGGRESVPSEELAFLYRP